MLKYKGYIGTVEFDDEAEIFHGEVALTRDVIIFQCTSVDELRQAFRDSIIWHGARSAAKKRKNWHSLSRESFLRDFFEVDVRYIALTELAKLGKLEWSVVQGAMKDFGIKDDKKNPLLV